MADNYVENHYNDYLKRKARKEAAMRHRQHLFLEAYRKKLAQEKLKMSENISEPNSTQDQQK